MRVVTPALKHLVFPVLSRSGFLRSMAGSGPAIVTYHGVFPANYKIRNSALDGNLIHAESLRRQLTLLKKHYCVITPEDFLQWLQGKMELPQRSVLLTCDDTLQNNLTEMLPILQEFGASCLFFATGASANVTPSMLWYEELYLMLLEANGALTLSLPEAGIRVDTSAPSHRHAIWWDLVERLSAFDGQTRRKFMDQICIQLKLPENWAWHFFEDKTLASRFLTLDVAGLQQLADAGMTIGAHSLSHPALARAADELAYEEISASRALLEEALGRTVWAFGYPFGTSPTVTERDMRLTERVGYSCAFMNMGGGFGAKGVSAGDISRFALPRVHVTADMNLAEFEAHISGFYRSLRERLLGQPQPTNHYA